MFFIIFFLSFLLLLFITIPSHHQIDTYRLQELDKTQQTSSEKFTILCIDKAKRALVVYKIVNFSPKAIEYGGVLGTTSVV